MSTAEGRQCTAQAVGLRIQRGTKFCEECGTRLVLGSTAKDGLQRFSVGWVLLWERGCPARLKSAQDGRAPRAHSSANCYKLTGLPLFTQTKTAVDYKLGVKLFEANKGPWGALPVLGGGCPWHIENRRRIERRPRFLSQGLSRSRIFAYRRTMTKPMAVRGMIIILLRA